MDDYLYQDYENRMYAPNAAEDIAGSGTPAYPEIYFKLQPHILMACDQIDAANLPMTKQLMEKAAGNIHSNIIRTNPETADYAADAEKNASLPEARAAITYGAGYGPGYGRGDRSYRSRGFLRDLIDILLLSEYYRRRRNRY